jgi:hypothetical protein
MYSKLGNTTSTSNKIGLEFFTQKKYFLRLTGSEERFLSKKVITFLFRQAEGEKEFMNSFTDCFHAIKVIANDAK